MRVVFLTHYYPPEVGAPQARISALAAALRARGVEASVHTAFPHYPDGRVQEPYRNRPLSREVLGEVPVVRSAVYPAPNAGFARRLANHASFAASALLSAPASGGADVVVVESPPLFTAAAGIAYARAKRAALVLNVADRWPASAVELGALQSRPAIRAAEALERTCYRAAHAIAVPTAGLVGELDAVAQARGKVHHLAPAVDLELFETPPREPATGPLRLLYAGTVGLAQGVHMLVDAALRAGPEVVEVTIAGDGAEREAVQRLAAAGDGAHIHVAGRVPHADVPGLYAAADAAVVLLRDRPLFERAVPTKILEAMASGTPVVLSARGEAAELIRSSGGGVVVAPEDPAALAAALQELSGDRARLQALGEAARRHARDHFGRERSVERWLAVLEEAVAARRLSRRSGPGRAP